MKLTLDDTTKEFLKPYMIPLVGTYNAGVFECPHCGKNILGNFYTHIIGFAYAPIGFVEITECPKCFEKYYSHCSDVGIDLFKYHIENNTNIHFKKD